MKLIALKDFFNNFGLPDDDLEVHPKQVHKGHEFEIGTADKLEKLNVPERLLVAQLTVAGCVAEAKPETVKSVQAEVIADRKREATAAKLNQQADASGLVKVLTDLLSKANAAAAAGATTAKS